MSVPTAAAAVSAFSALRRLHGGSGGGGSLGIGRVQPRTWRVRVSPSVCTRSASHTRSHVADYWQQLRSSLSHKQTDAAAVIPSHIDNDARPCTVVRQRARRRKTKMDSNVAFAVPAVRESDRGH
eukprot:345365-Prymnesium_polylepis.2